MDTIDDKSLVNVQRRDLIVDHNIIAEGLIVWVDKHLC